MRKESVIENKYTIRQTDQSLTTKILGIDLDRMEKNPASLDEDFLNHWIDHAKYQGSDDEIVLSTQLADDESTVSEYRSSVNGSDLMEFKDKMIPVMRACLEFAYYQEKSKQWKTPLNPLNLIYRVDETGRGHISAFYREPCVRKSIDSEFLDDVVKLITYLFIPEEEDSIERYPEMTGQSYLDSIASSSDFYEMYGDDGDDLIDFICSCLTPRNQSGVFGSVKDIMDNVGAFDEEKQVESPSNHGAVENVLDDTINLNDYQPEPEPVSADDVKSEEPELSPKEKKKKEQEETIKKQQEELEEKKAEKAKAKAEKKKKKQQQKEAQRKALEKQQKELEKAKKEKDPKPKKKSKLPIFIAAGILLGGGAFLMYNHNKSNQNEPKTSQSAPSSSKTTKQDPSDNPYFKKATDAAANSDYKDAASYFNQYFDNGGSQNDLNNSQTSMVFNSYLRDGDYQKILDNIGSNDTATALINYLTSQNQLDKVNDLYGSEPIISFVKADNQKNYDKMVNLAGKVTLDKNQKLQDDACNAFAQTNKLQQGKEWAQDQSNSQDLINSIKAHAYQLNKMPHDQIDKALS